MGSPPKKEIAVKRDGRDAICEIRE